MKTLFGLVRIYWLIVLALGTSPTLSAYGQETEQQATPSPAIGAGDTLAALKSMQLIRKLQDLDDEVNAVFTEMREDLPNPNTQEGQKEIEKRIKVAQEKLKVISPKVIAAADAILAEQSVAEQFLFEAVQKKLEALQLLENMGVATAKKQMETFIEELKKDKRPQLNDLALQIEVGMGLEKLAVSPPEQQAKLTAELVEKIKSRPVDLVSFEMALEVAQQLEFRAPSELAAKAYDQFGAFFRDAPDADLARLASVFQGSARRMRLVGNTMTLTGKTLSEEDFDWKSYDGKVVLVDFWATWCGPCVESMPELKALHKAYHDDGFEIVGISGDDSRARVQQFVKQMEIPWTNLYGDKDGMDSPDNPNADYYGVTTLPFWALIGRDGKVVATSATAPGQVTPLVRELMPRKTVPAPPLN